MLKAAVTGLTLLAFLISCNTSRDKPELITSLQSSLGRSCHIIASMSETTLAQLKEKSTTPSMSYKAGIWLPKAEQANDYKNKLISEIDRVLKTCEDNHGNCKEAELASLIQQLKAYSDSSLAIDPYIRKEFTQNFEDSPGNQNSILSIAKQLNIHDDLSQAERLALLTQLKLAAVQHTDAIIRFCNEQVSNPGFYFTVYSAIVAQNSQALLPGEELKITAGIGNFSKAARPKVLINGQPCSPGEDATFNYSIIPKGEAGIYHLPVVLDFIDENGEPRKISKKITYRLLPAPVSN